MTRSNSKGLILSALAGSIFSLSVSAGTMGDVATPMTWLLLEAGGSYTTTFFKDHVRTPESFTVATPYGVQIQPDAFYPDNFGGGYIGASILRNDWLFNLRYDMFARSTQTNTAYGTIIKIAPNKLTLSLDKVWGAPGTFTYGLGAGVVVATANQASAYTPIPHLTNGQLIQTVHGESIQGRTRIDPQIEALAMYPLAENVNIKLNVGYQIPVSSFFSDGSLNVNLGLNYALPL